MWGPDHSRLQLLPVGLWLLNSFNLKNLRSYECVLKGKTQEEAIKGTIHFPVISVWNFFALFCTRDSTEMIIYFSFWICFKNLLPYLRFLIKRICLLCYFKILLCDCIREMPDQF